MRYFVEKKKYSTQNVDHIYIVFQNGNYLTIEKNELVDININLYDRLTRYEYSASFVGHSGYVKLKISSEKKTYSDDDDCTRFLYNHDVYKENRKSYIENRCTKENDINYVIFFDDNRWNDMIFGDIRCRMEGEFLVLQFEQNQKYGAVGADTAYIDMPDVSKKDILKINLVFENCESVMIYHDEIREISLTFENQLKWAGGNFCRSIQSGVLKLQFLNYFRNRDVHFWTPENKKTTIRIIKKRLCGKGQDIHDICHLYITYGYIGYGYVLEEKIEIADMCFYDEKPEVYNKEEGEEIFDAADEFFIGGCANTEQDGSVTVKFGACCADETRKIAEVQKYPVTIKEFL